MKQINDLKWAFKLWLLTSTVPLTVTIMNIIFVGVLGVETTHNFWYNFKLIWSGYYFDGRFMGVDAWRWHLAIFICSFLFVKIND